MMARAGDQVAPVVRATAGSRREHQSVERRIQRDENEFGRTLSFFDATFALAMTLLVTTIDPGSGVWGNWLSMMATVLYLIARHDGLLRHPPDAEEVRLAIIDQSVPTLVFVVSIPVAIVVSGSAGRWCWLSLVAVGPVMARWTDRRRRQERRLLGLLENDD